MARIEALDRDRSAPIECSRGPRDPINARALNKGFITVVINLAGRIVIVGSQSNDDKMTRFITTICADYPDRPSRSNDCDFFETVHDGTFHRKRRSFRSDGYAQISYKTMCSSQL